MHLIAQLLDYGRRILRSMKTAQPGIIRGKKKTIECLWRFLFERSCKGACVGCIHNRMHAEEKHYLTVAFSMERNQIKFRDRKTLRFTPNFSESS